ncbi:spore germination protein [Alkaliphilus hydrothermalis]|uniref:Spore germination protein n=1 Tax=Alkaliphilus hydrothermalis TaxID=1482730 RepID=A0ABS2NSK6_9FIRM|nr:spore germination protein [Alkaliphilus hydrothermalis]MBM7615949.1 spore germination protein [Alkaliphilus hydrothermalis]
MGLWKKIFGEKKKEAKAGKTMPDKKLDKNLETIKAMLKDCDDIVYREFEIGVDQDYKAALVYVDGMADKILINNFILSTSMVATRIVEPTAEELKQQLSQHMKDHTFAVTEVSEQETMEDAVKFALSGDTIILLDNCEKIFTVGSKGFPARGVSEPVTEAVIRGPRDGFTEVFRFNTALIRRRIRDTKLKVKQMQLGARSKTDVAIMYIEDVVNEGVLKEVKRRLDTIDIDIILDSGYVEQFIEDDWTSPFPQIQNTERPDVVTAALYEGRVAIVVDNSPFVLIVPGTINAMMQSAEDYYERWSIATAVRLLRYFAATLSLLLPSLYVAFTSFHPQMMPTQLTLALAVNREGVPFPAIVEALIMETTIEILREAGVRLPGPIGATIGIVGGLVIGQAAVEAGLVAPLMVIVVAVTAISSFAIPRYNLAIGFRLLRFLFIFAAGALGLYGIMLSLLLVLIHLASLKSFGVPYLSPFVTFIEESGDIGDTFVRAPLLSMNNRNAHVNPNNRNRMDDRRRENFGDKEEK